MARVISVFILACACLYPVSSISAKEPSIDISSLKDSLSGYTGYEEAYYAIEVAQDEIEKNPRNAANYAELAYIYDTIGQYQKALEAVKLWIKYSPEKSPDWSLLYQNLAMEYLNVGRIDDAKKPILKSLKLDPGNIASRAYLLNYYYLNGKYKEASPELKKLTSLDKERDFYHEIYARHSDRGKNNASLIELFKRSVDVDPDNHQAHRALGIAIRDLSFASGEIEKDFPSIMKSFNRALELNRKYIPTYISIADTYMFLARKSGKKAYFNDSIRWFGRAYRLDPKNYKLAYSKGFLFMCMKEYDKAIEQFEYAYYAGGYDEGVKDCLVAAYNQKAYWSHYKTGINMEKGLQTINKAIMLDEDNGIVLSTKAELLYKMERYEEAYEYIKKGIKLEPNQPEIKQDLENIEKKLKGTCQKGTRP